jgi:hypothetical protein
MPRCLSVGIEIEPLLGTIADIPNFVSQQPIGPKIRYLGGAKVQRPSAI